MLVMGDCIEIGCELLAEGGSARKRVVGMGSILRPQFFCHRAGNVSEDVPFFQGLRGCFHNLCASRIVQAGMELLSLRPTVSWHEEKQPRKKPAGQKDARKARIEDVLLPGLDAFTCHVYPLVCRDYRFRLP
jgi:hypothetical protein